MSEDKQNIQSAIAVDGVNKFISFFNQRQIEEAVWVFAELGIADLLVMSEAKNAEEICAQKGWLDAVRLRRLLYVAVVAGLLDIEAGNRFKLTSTGELLTSNHPSKSRNYVLTFLTPGSDSRVHILIRGNEHTTASESKDITHLYSELSNEMMVAFASIMSTISYNTGPVIAKAIDAFSRCSMLVDVGGSRGTLLANILSSHRNIVNSIVFDLPSTINHASSSMDDNDFERLGISPSRYRFVGGDIFDPNTVPKADGYLLKYILHNMNDENAIKALKSLYKVALRPARIFIIELVLDEPITSEVARRQWTVYAEDFIMLGTDEGRERTLQQYVDLLQKAGLTFFKLHEIGLDERVIESYID
ncbi:unnamed protein product [Rotaria socialis]|uniref:Acetylserotonin O-methyltransferase n=1 Tax=Rotaria socialis TaxID=392032 RepID=A0A817S6X2_9BILA|nr:unnamed protein product [Rotaria socialis]CAF3743367.1 unnamed protein product [Rotaria socialis]